MKKILLSFLLWGFCNLLLAQNIDLLTYNQTRLQKQHTSMLVLGGWAIGNIALGAALYGSRQGEDRYFHLMNAGWNLVNLGLATAGYLAAAKADPGALDLYATVKAQYNTEKIFLLNAGLDVGYMLGGLYLIERSKTAEKKPERLKGFGKSIILQGGFLFAFDLAAYFIQASHHHKLEPLMSSLYFDGQSLGMVFRF